MPSFVTLQPMVAKLKRPNGVRNESGETRVLVFPRNAVCVQVPMFGAHFGQLSLRIFSSGLRQKIRCGFYFTMVTKNPKWPVFKTQIKGGAVSLLFENGWSSSYRCHKPLELHRMSRPGYGQSLVYRSSLLCRYLDRLGEL